METKILYLFTRTPLHVGAGSSVGAVDQPVQRERHTGYPIIPGSSIKGVLRDQTRTRQPDQEAVLYGHPDGDAESVGAAGILSFAEAKLMLFPLRSAKGSYAMVTCPLALRRYCRDSGLSIPVPDEPGDMECLAGATVTLKQSGGDGVALEEYRFASKGDFPEDWATHLAGVLDDAVLNGAERRFVLLSNGDFAYFAMNACQVSQHVRISHETGTAEQGGLFNEETVPSETLFYTVLSDMARNDEHKRAVEAARENLADEQLIQFGGNGTTGLGFCTVKLI